VTQRGAAERRAHGIGEPRHAHNVCFHAGVITFLRHVLNIGHQEIRQGAGLLVGILDSGEHARFGNAGAQGGDADAVGLEFFGEGLGQ